MKIIDFFFLLVLFCSCKKEFKTEKDFFAWLNAPENGLVKTKEIDQFKITVKYLPTSYLAYLETKNNNYSIEQIDSIKCNYINSKTFLLTIEPVDKRKGTDLLFQDAVSYEQYKQRVLDLNFNAAEFIKIKANGNEYLPVLTNMENAYNIDTKKNITLVFVDEGKSKGLFAANELDFTFTDQIFNTGINHFVFSKKDLDNTPSFLFN
jgi:hypothetical protein